VASGGQTTAFGHDAAGNLTTTTLPSGNGYVATRTFDRAGRLTTVDNAKSGTSLSKFLWTLDPGGNPTKQQTTRGGTDTYDVYAYDTRNRLTDSCFGVSSGTTTCSGATNAITYSYDKVSNRTQEVRSGSVGNTGTIDYAYNSADQLTGTTKSGTTTSYTYDANGNAATAGSKSFTYGLADRLVSATSGGTTTSYAYDGDIRRNRPALRLDPLADSGLPELALERTGAGTFVHWPYTWVAAMSSGDLVEAADHWILPLQSRQVTQCRVDFALTFLLGDSDDPSYLTVEQPFRLRLLGKPEVVLVPDGPGEALGPALAVLRSSVARAIAFKNGDLEIEFDEGIGFFVPASAKFEAWNLVGPAGMRIVSLPGGELAVWGPEAPTGERR
jgi:hypothetical protein